MVQDVNQGEMDVAAQVRSALVDKISSERYELWIPSTTKWTFENEALHVSFESEFTCQLAKRMLGKELVSIAGDVVGSEVEILFSAASSGANPRWHNNAEKRSAASGHLAAKQAVKQAAEQTLTAKPQTAKVECASPQTAAATHCEAVEVRSGGSARPGPRQVVQTQNSQTEPNASSQFLAPRAVDECGSKTDDGYNNNAALHSAAFNSTTAPTLHYVSGNSNQLATSTARLVIEEPGRLTPVLFHGPQGCGKSLLVDAIANQLRTAKRLRRVVHMTSEQFTNDFTDGLRGGGLPMFRRKYRDVDALILEDIQFFAGKKSTLAEVKHTLDNLLRLRKQVIFTADRSANELQPLGSELLGRIRGGLTSPIFPLDEQTRREILRRETAMVKITLPETVIEEIAARATGDGRVLSGIVKRLVAVAAFEPEPLTWESCWSAIHDLVQATQPVVRMTDIERVICDVFGLEPNSLQSTSKTRRVSQPRMLAMFLARKYTPAAYKEIGQYFGHRRHSTVISAEKTVEVWLAENTNLDVGRGLRIRDAIRHVESQLQVG